jgi:hypothetical protein
MGNTSIRRHYFDSTPDQVAAAFLQQQESSLEGLPAGATKSVTGDPDGGRVMEFEYSANGLTAWHRETIERRSEAHWVMRFAERVTGAQEGTSNSLMSIERSASGGSVVTVRTGHTFEGVDQLLAAKEREWMESLRAALGESGPELV